MSLRCFCLFDTLIRFHEGYMPPGAPNGTHKPAVHPAGFPLGRVPLPPYHGAPPSQPYAIPSRGAVHGPVGAVPQVPQPGSRGFGAGRGSAAPIGSHLPHQQASQQPVGSLGPNYIFPLESPNGQQSGGGPLSQPGFVSNVSILFFLFFFFWGRLGDLICICELLYVELPF